MAPDGSGSSRTRACPTAPRWATAWTASRSPSTARRPRTDTFELEPVGRAADSMKRVLDNPTGIAAASPMTAVMGVANKGTATVDGLERGEHRQRPERRRRRSPSPTPTAATPTRSTDASGNVTASGNGHWTPGQPIALNGFELNLNGVPASGDTIAVARRRIPRATTATRWRWSRCATRPSSAATCSSTARCRAARRRPTPTRARSPTWACACRAPRRRRRSRPRPRPRPTTGRPRAASTSTRKPAA